jgi:uncharacterized delta-60 repeat protein
MNLKLLRIALPICLVLAGCNSSTSTDAGPPTAFTVARVAGANGARDITFGAGNGMAIVDVDPPVFDFALAIAVQADNKIVVGGSDGFAGQGQIALVRLNTDGTLDAAGFGTGGIVRTKLASPASASQIAIQADGKIVVAALTIAASTTSITLLRYNSNGTLDTAGFVVGQGFVTAAIGPGLAGDTCGLVLQPDGKIVVAGGSQNGNVVLYRYDSAGVLDPAFGIAGKTTTNLGVNRTAASPAIALQSDNRIILVSGNGADQVVLRYGTDGAQDTTFGAPAPGGIVATDIGGFLNFANAVAIQPDDGIVVAGHAFVTGTASDISVVRYTKDGVLDTSFKGTNIVGTGIVTTDIGGQFDNAFSVVLQPQLVGNPKILVSGNTSVGAFSQTAVLRYNPDGTLDNMFGGNAGLLLIPVVGPSNISSGNALALQADGKILIAGFD